MCSTGWGWGEDATPHSQPPSGPKPPRLPSRAHSSSLRARKRMWHSSRSPRCQEHPWEGTASPGPRGTRKGGRPTAGPQLGAFLSRHTTSAYVCPSGPLQEGSWLGPRPQTRHDPQPQEWGAGVGLFLLLSLSLLCLYHLCSWVLRSGGPCTTIYPHYPEGTLAPWGWGRGRRQTVGRVQEGPTASALDPRETQLGSGPSFAVLTLSSHISGDTTAQ